MFVKENPDRKKKKVQAEEDKKNLLKNIVQRDNKSRSKSKESKDKKEIFV